MKRLFLICSLLLISISAAFATHNRAGAITYVHISGNTYEFTITTCTKSSAPADRPWLPITWGDGTPADSIQRSQIFILDPNPVDGSQQNTYVKRHTFPGSGTYTICVSDPNRNAGIINITNSVLIPFALKTTLRISPIFEANNSVTFTNDCLQDACINQPWVYNPGVSEIDGDSLSYKLVRSMTVGCEPLDPSIYRFPNLSGNNQPPNNSLTIDPLTGTVTWDFPQQFGEYNLAILVEEWRSGVMVGSVIFDTQVTVETCNNQPPVLEAIRDTCVEAGEVLNVSLSADDPDGNNVMLSGYGLPFNLTVSPALPIEQGGLMPPVTGTFIWPTNCAHVRLAPYQVTIEAGDNGNGNSLVDIKTFNVTVVAPGPENLTAEPQGSSIVLNWDQSPCDEAIAYKIYRRIDSSGFVPARCETGVPEYTGYTQVGTVEGLENTTYTDDNEIIFGRKNCYIVVACFPDGAESYASNEVCADIRFEIPIIKKNSIGLSAVNGTDTVAWRSPIELDPDVFLGPYQYRLLRSEGYGEATEVVFESAVEASLDDLPESFISQNLNTNDTAHTYRVELYSNGEFAARSNLASSLFIELDPNDNRMGITWREEVPWLNFEYEIYRQTDGTGEFELIDISEEAEYVDSNLVNNRTYCYYIVSRGSYFAIEENDTLINYSQRACAQPYDRNPPCAPELVGESDCVGFTTDLEWTNPIVECPETDDVTAYNVYFTPVEGGEFELLETINSPDILDLALIFNNTVAGCYAITALDSLAPWPSGELVQNESALSNIICFDNCPVYELPNVFTPNGDGRNDFFKPFPYRSVDSVDFKVYNRWGRIIFETSDPDILWDGTSIETGERVSDATYFYSCRVFTIRLTGLEPVDLSGYIQVFAEPGNNLD